MSEHGGRPKWWPWVLVALVAVMVAVRVISSRMEEETKRAVSKYAAAAYRVEPVPNVSIEFPSSLYAPEFTPVGDGGQYSHTELLAKESLSARPVVLRFDYRPCSGCTLEQLPIPSKDAQLQWAEKSARGGTVLHYVERAGEYAYRERLVAVSKGYRFEVTVVAKDQGDFQAPQVRQFFDSVSVR